MGVDRWIVNSAFKLQPRHVYQKLCFISRWVEIKEKLKKVASSELKHLFTIHLFTFFFYSLKENKGRSTRYKHEKSNKHTIVHGCNPTKQGVSVEVRCSLEIKSKNGKLVLVGVKTPIHLFTYSLPSVGWVSFYPFFFLSFIRKRWIGE